METKLRVNLVIICLQTIMSWLEMKRVTCKQMITRLTLSFLSMSFILFFRFYPCCWSLARLHFCRKRLHENAGESEYL